MTIEEFKAHKASERAEHIRGILGPFEKRRAELERAQAHVEEELVRLRSLQPSSGGSEKITAQIADLDREWLTLRNAEARLNEEHGVAKNNVAHLRP
jgi:hypothetical protein